MVKKMETVTSFIFLGSKITLDDDCSSKLKDAYSFEEKLWQSNCCVMLKSRDIFLPSKICIVKTMVFPVVQGCESWTIKKDECWRIDAFELCCWRRHLRVPWTARRSNQAILKEISPEYSLEGLLLKLQHFGHLMWEADSLEKTLMLREIGGRRRVWQRIKQLDSITNSMDINLGKLWEMVRDRETWRATVHGVAGHGVGL